MKTYRKNAGIVVFRADGKVLLCERVERYSKNWQFPQGGIDIGETPLEAAVRELREETSIVGVEYVAALSEPLRYDFPDEIKKNNLRHGIKNDGQEQYWHLFYFTGKDADINLQTDEQEFKSFQWVDIKDAPDLVVEFKKHVYEVMVEQFAKEIYQYLHK